MAFRYIPGSKKANGKVNVDNIVCLYTGPTLHDWQVAIKQISLSIKAGDMETANRVTFVYFSAHAKYHHGMTDNEIETMSQVVIDVIHFWIWELLTMDKEVVFFKIEQLILGEQAFGQVYEPKHEPEALKNALDALDPDT